ncbi:MAG TPA: PAS domain-containing sensor histidine kinase [Burkholderiales bacterium]|nr:PAS domain-containing sensor histidine kinase [Burkholderiales bacterium]
MSQAGSRQAELWDAPGARAYPGAHSEQFWRSLFYFNVYRLLVALLLLLSVTVWGSNLWFGSRDLALFLATDLTYVIFSIACFVVISARRHFDLQLTLQVAADVVFIVLLIHASGGISSGLGLLLLTTLAGAGLISRGRLSLFFAALASIGVLLQHTYATLELDAPDSQFVQAGLLSGAFFAIAWLAHALAKYTVASEQLAAKREIDLANMEQVNQLVIRDMPDGVLVVDGHGAIRQFNARAERLLGPLPASGEAVLSEYAPPLAAQYKQWRTRAGVDSGAGMPYSSSESARFVPIGANRELGAVIFIEDQTRVQAQARQLKLAALGRLTANIAHEIRNPLGAISHAAQLLREEPGMNDTAARLISIINENSGRLDRMVNDVLRLNRGERARRERFRLATFLAGFVEQFSQIEKIDPGVVRIEQQADPDVLFDRSHLNQVMWNLCRNALRHCRRGPASIVIRFALERAVGVVRLDVVDDGPGVIPEARAQLFEPFFTTATGGTGLGLYIAREVCEVNGATLDYVETPGGAQFTVRCWAG